MLNRWRKAMADRQQVPAAPAVAGAERLTFTVPEAGRLLGLSRNGAYAAARAGLIPVLVVGRRRLVPKAALHQMLDAAGTDWERAREAASKSEAHCESDDLTKREQARPPLRRVIRKLQTGKEGST